MTTTLTISAPLAMAAVPGLIAIGGVVVGIALNGWLTTGIEVARLNAANDDRTARWLWLRGYRKTPHAGPDVHDGVVVTPSGVRLVQTTHPELLPADPHVTGELLAVDGVDTETDAPHEDDHHSDAPAWQVWLAAIAAVFIVAVLLPVWLAWMAGEWVYGKAQSLAAAWRRRRDERYLIGSGEQAVDPSQPLREVLAASGSGLEPPASDVELEEAFAAWSDADTGWNPQGAEEEPSEVEERALLDTAWAAANPPTNRTPYVGRHWSAGTEHTDLFPVVNPSIPAQRTEAE